MKRAFLFLLLIPFLGITQNAVEKKGFEKYIFGTSPTDYNDLVLEIDEGDTKLYSTEKPVPLNGVEFEQVHVTFSKGKLTSVAVKTKNSTGSKFLESLKAQYGQPVKANVTKGLYEWKSTQLQLHYEKNQSGQDASASFYSIQPRSGQKKS
jgi:hypothetical protein